MKSLWPVALRKSLSIIIWPFLPSNRLSCSITVSADNNRAHVAYLIRINQATKSRGFVYRGVHKKHSLQRPFSSARLSHPPERQIRSRHREHIGRLFRNSLSHRCPRIKQTKLCSDFVIGVNPFLRMFETAKTHSSLLVPWHTYRLQPLSFSVLLPPMILTESTTADMYAYGINDAAQICSVSSCLCHTTPALP